MSDICVRKTFKWSVLRRVTRVTLERVIVNAETAEEAGEKADLGDGRRTVEEIFPQCVDIISAGVLIDIE